MKVDSQQTLIVRYLSIFFEIKDSDRTNPVSDEVQPTRLPPQKKQE